MSRKLGLTLGKFAPLHKGHQLLIETALAEMDAVTVLIYDCPETTPVPLNVRAGWLRALYPQAQVVEAWDGPNEVGDTPEIRKLNEDYVLRRLAPSRFTHFYCSEFYGEHMSLALGAVNRLVDRARQAVPVSGTQIRRDPHAHRAFLHPRVYRDLIVNAVLLGAPSTGKTTLAERLAQEHATVWMPEHGREYWERHQVERRLTAGQLVELAEQHLDREEALLAEARGVLFADTNALTTYLFSQHYHGTAEPRLAQLAAECAARYDLVFLCGTDIPYDDTWDRSGDADRLVMQRRTLAELQARKIPYFPLHGDLESRVKQANEVLRRHRKYGNLVELHGALPAARSPDVEAGRP